MNIVAIIPARGGSKAIPRKNLINFCGKPLMLWSIEQARHSRYINNVFVSSDNDEILSVARKAGAGAIIRPKRIAGDKSSSDDALLHALDKIEGSQNEKVDLIVFLQATSPLRLPEDIDQAIKMLIVKKADSLFSAAKLEDFCLWKESRGKLESMTYDHLNRGRRQERNR